MLQRTHRNGRGLLDSLTNLVATLLAIAHTRLDLLASDLEEEREHFVFLAICGVAGMFCLGVGVVLAAVLCAVAFWDTHRLLVLGLLSGAFIAAGVIAALLAVKRIRAKPRLFAASLSELFKDRQQFASRT